MDKKISIVSPVYKSEELLDQLVGRISTTVEKISTNYEIILVDDSSPDNSWNKINEICAKNKKVIGIQLSRNFGQHYAITAGLDHANGEWIVVMDCDLQDVPEEIINLYEETKKGYEIVLARRNDRKDKFSQKFFSFFFYKFLDYLTGIKHDEKVANFGIYHSKVIKAIISMRENVRYFPIMVKWVGFKVGYVNVQHASRDGETSYVLKKRINIALDVILSYSDKPLKIFVKLGMLISLISIIISMYYFIQWSLGHTIVLGYTSLIISIWFLSGIILAALGIIGLYVGKTFQDVKKRPIYVINEILND
jgi:glycosyltransferase involved in cell wall biosynthesis